MIEEKQFYECKVCGNIVEVKVVGGGDLACCGEEMKLMEEKAVATEGNEKHMPVIVIDGEKVTVKVGDVPHPMTPEHWISIVQLMKGDKVLYEKKLTPEDEPVAEFIVSDTEGLSARAYCNKHGLWKNA